MSGVHYALLAYGAWGFFPLYWKLIQGVSSVSIVAHRILWAWVFYTLIISIKNRRLVFGGIKKYFQQDRRLSFLICLSAGLITVNWLLYVWGVRSGQIVETSLGYFINPLVNIILGVFLLKETLNKDQKIAVFFACLGVLYLSLQMGRLPWIALGLAVSFSFYGFVRKKMQLSALEGGQAESLLMILPVFALAFFSGAEPFQFNASTGVLLVFSGVITGLPLIWFVEAGQRLPYSVLGFFQYIAPTLQFLTGVFVFHEEMNFHKLTGFIFIWIGLGWLVVRSLIKQRG